MKQVERRDEKAPMVDRSYASKRLFKKGVNSMADGNLAKAAEQFEQALRMDPGSVETMLKLGYARFHDGDHAAALKQYEAVLDIDVTNPEAWNLKGIVHYTQKDHARALDCTIKSIESDPTYGMAWYNKACYLSLLGQVPAALEALKRSIEIDVSNARRSVKDADFANVRLEEGFSRIRDVVVLEAVRQGRHTIGSIVWSTFLSRADTEEALDGLVSRGMLVKNERREGFKRVPVWDLAIDAKKKNAQHMLKSLPVHTKRMKGVINAVLDARGAIERGDPADVASKLEAFVDPEKLGREMIDQFLEEHREIRLWRARLDGTGAAYLAENREEMLRVLGNIEAAATVRARGSARTVAAGHNR